MTEAQWLASEDPAAMIARLTAGRAVTPGVGGPHLEATADPPRTSDRKLRLLIAALHRIAGHLPTALAFESEPHPHLHWDLQHLAFEAIRRTDHAYTITHGIYDGMSPAQQAALLRDIVGNPFRPVVLPPGPPVECRLCNWLGKINPPCETCGGYGRVEDPEGMYEDSTKDCPDCDPIDCPKCKGMKKLPGPSPCLTPQVRSLALAAYEEREPLGTLDLLRLAILADALEEAGCPLLEACRFCHGTRRVPVPVGYLKCDCVDRQPHPILAHLRSPGPHYRGCWAVDLVLGKE